MGLFFSRQRALPAPPASPMLKRDWREISWGQNCEMKEELRTKPKHPSVRHVRILAIGPVQAGKSSFIYSVKSILQQRLINGACMVSAGDKSFTKNYTVHAFKDGSRNPLPFVIGDVMGLENGDESGVHPDDIINILEGHIKEEYKFNPVNPCSKQDPQYRADPTVSDMIHCLMFIISTENFITNSSSETNVFLSPDLIKKMQTIRRKATDLKIPHIVVLTKADLACHDVQEDIKLVYKSKVIHRKAQACSKALGIPMNCIFPVKNYSNEMELDPDMDAVLLHSLAKILDAASDFVEEMQEVDDNSMNGRPTM